MFGLANPELGVLMLALFIVFIMLGFPIAARTVTTKASTHTRGARARLAAPGRGATRGGVERAERKERKEEGHPFPPGEWGGIRGVSGVPSRKQCYQPGKGGPRPSGQG